MNKFFHFSFYFFIFLSLVACGEKKQTETKMSEPSVVIIEELPDINLENIKANKKALLQQMANELYLEAEKEIKASPAVKMDERGIYDDIKKVDVEFVDLDSNLSPDVGSSIAKHIEAERKNQEEIHNQRSPIVRISPKYPVGVTKSQNGFVQFEFTILTYGHTDQITLIDSNLSQEFIESAKSALKEWRYAPRVENGVAVEYRTQAKIVF